MNVMCVLGDAVRCTVYCGSQSQKSESYWDRARKRCNIELSHSDLWTPREKGVKIVIINFIYFNVKILLTGIFFTHRCQCKPYLKVSFGKKDTDVSTKKWQISLDSAVHLVFLLARLCSTNYNVLSLVKRKASE